MGERKCKRCRKTLPESAFYPITGRGWRALSCWDCMSSRMAKWAATPLNKHDPNKVRETDD